MLYYRCSHCGHELGQAPQEPEPICPDHPNGVVEQYEDGNTQSE